MNRIEAYKGIAPGKIIFMSLKKSGITQRQLAQKIHEHYQTINAIINDKRLITIPLSLKLDDALQFEKGFFAVIQTYYLLKKQTKKTEAHSNHPIIRDVVFWDIDTDKLDWITNKEFIIKRVHERGNSQEIELINNYYGCH